MLLSWLLHLTLLREGTTWLVCYGDRVMGRVVRNERYLGRWCAQFGDGTLLGGELKLRVAIEAVAGYPVRAQSGANPEERRSCAVPGSDLAAQLSDSS
jgi:hypothetical protein